MNGRMKQAAWLCVVILLWGMTGCKTAQGLLQNKQVDKGERDKLYALSTTPKEVTDITSRISVTLNGKDDKRMTVKGRLRMRRDEVVQLSLTALGVVEVAYVEFTPNTALVIDRINKRYLKMKYTDHPLLEEAGINFNTLQALFWNQLFLPGEKKVASRTDAFEITDAGNQQCIVPKTMHLLECKFYTDKDCLQLQETQVGMLGHRIAWHDDAFQQYPELSFPASMDISLMETDLPYSARIVLNSLTLNDKSWSYGVNLSRYHEMSLDALLKTLKRL